MKKVNVIEANDFSETGMKKLLVHDSPYFKILNFNFKAGQELPVHAHDIEGQVSLVVLEGKGEFLGKDGAILPATQGDVLIPRSPNPTGSGPGLTCGCWSPLPRLFERGKRQFSVSYYLSLPWDL